MTLTKEQFYKNSIWTFAELTLFPLLVIIATPVFINRLGIEQYGLWILVNTITQGMNVLNVGVGDTNIRLISQYRAENKLDKIKQVFGYNFSLSLFLCFAAILAGALFGSFNLISVFYKSTDYTFANSILLLACVSTGIKLVELSIISVFKAFERFDKYSKLSLISKNSVVISNLAVVLCNQGLVQVFTATVIINALNIGLQLLSLKRFKDNLLAWPHFRFWKEKLGEINYNFWYWLQSSIALLGFLSDKLAVAWFTDVKTLGYYSIASMIGTNIHNFFLAFGGFIFPRVSFKRASGGDLTPTYLVARSLIALPGWIITVFLLLCGDFIFKLWLGDETFLLSSWYIKLYLVFESGMLLIIVPFYFINGTQQLRLNSVFEGLIRSSHFLAMLLGHHFAGINGILYGLIISTFINIPFQYYYFHKKIMPSMSSFNFLLLSVPVYFMAFCLFSNAFVFQLSLVLAMALSAWYIYVKPAKHYSKQGFYFGKGNK